MSTAINGLAAIVIVVVIVVIGAIATMIGKDVGGPE